MKVCRKLLLLLLLLLKLPLLLYSLSAPHEASYAYPASPPSELIQLE